MTTTIDSWVLPVGLAPLFGSFVGVVISRVDQPRSIVFGRSACPSCGVSLGPLELIPLLSWLALGGRCRHCAKPIGAFHPLIELAALAVAIWAALEFSGGAILWASCVLGWTLLALAVIDYRHFLLPDFLTLPLIVIGLLVAWALNPSSLLDHVIGAIVGFGFIIVIRELYRRLRGRESMGLGDAKLLAASGAWVSWVGLPNVMLLAALSGLAFVLTGSLRGVKLSLADPVPFGTFLCLGTWIVWLYGQPIG